MIGPALGVVRIVLLHAWHHRVRTLLLAIAVAIALALPIASRLIVDRFETGLRQRAETVPLLVGAAGSRFDLVFTSLHFRRSELGTVPMSLVDELLSEQTDGRTRAIPLHARFTARGEPVVAVGFEYFGERGLGVAEGRLPARLGEVVLGARAASRLADEDGSPMGVGSELASDQRASLDITAPSSIVLEVVGVLSATGTPDDDAVFTDLATAWLLEGLSHGHEDARTIEGETEVLGKSEDLIALSGAVPTLQRVTDETAASFHLHSSPADLPITAVLVYPPSDKTLTILASRHNQGSTQAVRPVRVVDELVSFVLRLRTVFDAIAAVLALSTASLVIVVTVLNLRLRDDELRTLGEIGVSRSRVWCVALGDLVIVGVLAGAVAWALSWVSLAIAGMWLT